MYIFIDESGVDKKIGKSSVALVYLTTDHLENLQNGVIEIEKKLSISNFHWAHSAWVVRQKFVAEICRFEFSVKVALIKNPFKGSTDYGYALQHLVIEKNIMAVIIDGKKNKKYERRLKKVLREKNISIKKLRTANDESYPALRVADAIAGIVRYRNENPTDPRISDLYNLIVKKISITLEE